MVLLAHPTNYLYPESIIDICNVTHMGKMKMHWEEMSLSGPQNAIPKTIRMSESQRGICESLMSLIPELQGIYIW